MTPTNSQSADQRRGDPFPAAQRQLAHPPGLALDRRVLARVLQQVALQQHQRERDGDDADRDRGHQMVRRRAELVRELVEVRRQHQVAFRIAQHERQAEELEAQEEDEHRGEQQRRHDERQADRRRDAKRRGAGDTRGLLDVGAQALQRRRRVDVDVRHVREPGDHADRHERVDAPGRAAEEVRRPDGVEPDGTGGDDVAEGEHHRRDEARHEDQRLDPALAGQVGALHHEREQAAQWHRDDDHHRGQQERVGEGAPEVRIREDERVRLEAGRFARIEERRGEEALVEDERQRREHRRGRHQDREAAGDRRESRGAHGD